MEYALIIRLKIPELPKVRGNEKHNTISGIAHRKEHRIKQPSAHDLYRSIDLSMDSALVVLGLGCVPMFWAFLPKVTCGLVPRFAWGVSNFSDRSP